MMRITSVFTSVVLVLCASLAVACDTPVYRYAMYQWESAPYEVYYFHDSEPAEADVRLFKAFESIENRVSPQSNVTLIPVDLRQPEALKKLPPDVSRRWEQREDKTTPVCLTISPQGGLVSWQPLEIDSLAALLDSPARQQIAKELAAAKAGVMVVLTGTEDEANQTARQEVEHLAKQLEQGEVVLYRPPTDPQGNPVDPTKADDTPQIGIVVVDRHDPQEQWLVAALLAVEGDLPEIDKPMVFPIYGRGRALPPFVGAGITAGNLTDAVSFITGACSCTVKDQNPGVDLLITYDWESAADRMKEKFGQEEGNEEFSGSDLYPQLIIPGETGGPSTPEVAQPGEAAAHQPATSGEPSLAVAEHAPHASVNSEAAHGEAHEAHGSAGSGDSLGMFYTLGIGLGIGIVLLAAGTFIVFRPE